MSNKLENASIFYQSYINRPLELGNLKTLIQNEMGERFGIEFNPINAFVITWSNMRNQDEAIISTVTFQVVLVSDEFRSFVIFSYGELGFPCLEISLRHITNYLSLSSLESINQNSNVNKMGVYIYEVNGNAVFFTLN